MLTVGFLTVKISFMQFLEILDKKSLKKIQVYAIFRHDLIIWVNKT